MAISATDVLNLSVEERIELVGEIWNSIAAVPEQVELSPEVRELLETRLEEFRRNPDSGATWEEVKARLLNS